MSVTPVSTATTSSTSSSTSASSSNSPFGLNFQSLLQIILTQLTYQDPLKPLDNFEFVSQLAQFSQLEETVQLNANSTSLVTADSAVQAVGLIGHTVALTTGSGSSAQSTTGSVTSVTFTSGQPSLTVTTSGGQVLANVAISSITSVQ